MEGQENDKEIQESSLKSSNQYAKENNYTNFIEEWKSATNVSLEFDKMLLDLRKYGFSIITALITAGSFLGFSFSDTSPALPVSSNIIQIGVINVTMILVVILFWLDILYQNYLYASVFRTRILELFRLRYRLSVYISGLYTKSSMNTILNLIYGGFLIGVFILGLFVIGIAKSESNINTDEWLDSILNWITHGQGLLILSFASV